MTGKSAPDPLQVRRLDSSQGGRPALRLLEASASWPSYWKPLLPLACVCGVLTVSDNSDIEGVTDHWLFPLASAGGSQLDRGTARFDKPICTRSPNDAHPPPCRRYAAWPAVLQA
ncbi:hypothetical protein XAUB_40650 [Xanthomonas citri pv. aurantifolii str. ICPB 11122]|nr:hypothetical protein XAUB_40650 [Xanthomonas citri pv. aurantifolii str. ICPB 11122]EFF48923.1 hypothetical protein XAUC_06830 [Xanthomonas citri pv. aurantifolii str. ICPB 10535]